MKGVSEGKGEHFSSLEPPRNRPYTPTFLYLKNMIFILKTGTPLPLSGVPDKSGLDFNNQQSNAVNHRYSDNIPQLMHKRSILPHHGCPQENAPHIKKNLSSLIKV
ncbi:hypothetical protein A9R56_17565 [Escherichia coli]|nr:hypothetical protein [Escherichia coli]EGE4451794.1 hypothetical protein [Escherichia coli]KYR36925.1 hypothetical protein AML05_20890 [Escherichia coli]KYR57515.1 hypothetical protein AML08_19690 [Escherichia coli]KYT32498.1 hypothetical protein AML46_00285 [Escherichia coli]